MLSVWRGLGIPSDKARICLGSTPMPLSGHLYNIPALAAAAGAA